jgi:hypothetical protein
LVILFVDFLLISNLEQQRQEGMRDEDAQHDDISTTTSRRAPTTPTTPSTPSSPPSITTRGTIGPDGVLQLYPTLPGRKQFYVGTNPDRSRFNVSYGRNFLLPFTPKQDEEGSLTFFNTIGSPISYRSGQPGGRSVRLDVYPDGGMLA